MIETNIVTIFGFVNISVNSLYYYSSTAAQSFASLLGISIMIYIYLYGMLSSKCKHLNSDLSYIMNKDSGGKWIGNVPDGIKKYDDYLKTHKTLLGMETFVFCLGLLKNDYKKIIELKKLVYYFIINLMTVAFFISGTVLSETIIIKVGFLYTYFILSFIFIFGNITLIIISILKMAKTE